MQAYRADANTRDYAGKKPRQYMIVGDTGGMGLSMSSDTFRQLKDRRKNRTNRMEKNPGILRFGSLSVKVGLKKRQIGYFRTKPLEGFCVSSMEKT